jgi:MFS family permease
MREIRGAMRIRNNKKVTGALLGTIVEYYDYSLYVFSAPILAAKFFPGTDHIASLMYVFAIYSLSYVAKPLGSIFFSRLGDKYGRSTSLKITMIGISIPTLIIGMLPGYNSIGITTSYVLVLCRFFQGFFLAGEYDGAAIYVIEHMNKKYHYTASATTRATGVIGLLLSIASTNFFNSSVFPEWGWRIPFLLSMPLAIITIYYRNFLKETPAFIEAKKTQIEFTSLVIFVKRNWKNILLVILLSGGFGVTYQISIIFMKIYLPIIIPKSSDIISSFSVIIVLSFGLAMPISGFLADRLGRDIIFKVSLVSVLISCFLLIISTNYQLLNLAVVACLLLASSIAPFNALAHGVAVKAFKTEERYRGVSLGHATGSLLMSGTANYICLFFMKNYEFTLFPIIYIIFFTIIAYLAIEGFNRKRM